jgi:hypothetical protein
MKVLDCKALLISTLTLGIMATSLWGSNQEPKTDLPAVLVTKEVLIEYVDDRLIQLEETKNLSEEQAEELGYIRENRDDLRKLAGFYGMEIIEERPDKALSRQESPMREGHREPIKEASQSPVLKADTSQPKREPPVVDGTRNRRVFYTERARTRSFEKGGRNRDCIVRRNPINP